MPPIVACVLCGGSGSRLWPVSRTSFPKPFVQLPGRSSPLIDDTYKRLNDLSPAAVITITAAEYGFLCHESYARTGNTAEHIVIGEPCGRNTAAAIGMAAKTALARFGKNAVLVVLPADHDITDNGAFCHALQSAINAAANGALALLGIKPAHPATGYGYIESGNATDKDGVFTVHRFIEKPDLPTAKQLFERQEISWNAGIFCLTATACLNELQQHASDIAAALPTVGDTGDVFPTHDDYNKIPSISFDYAVVEKTRSAVVVRTGDIGWSDVGSWTAAAQTLPADSDGNRTAGNALLKDCTETFAAADGKRLVVGKGLKNLHIVDTPDALLVCEASASEEVRPLFEELRRECRPEADTPATVRRPWGAYTVLSENTGYKVKRIDVIPGGVLSLQSHKHRSEHWTTVLGVMTIVINDKEFPLAVDQSCYIPVGAKHRMKNDTDQPAAIIEVQCGDYLGENDIVRYEDIYGRIG